MIRRSEANNQAVPGNNVPVRLTRLLAGNRDPGVEPRLLFPGWGPKLWEKDATPESQSRELRHGGG